jgi:hypothetical protein
MPSSLPKYSGLISEYQLSILDEFIALHHGISKARVLGRLLEAWHDAGKPILGDRDATVRDLALQFEQLDLDALVAQKVQEYLDIHLDFLVNNLVENKLRPISNIDKGETGLDDNLVKNGLSTNDLEDDESLTEGNISDKGESKVVTDKDKDKKEVFSSMVQGEQLGDKQKEESEQVSNKNINQDNNLNKKDTNKDNNQVENLTEDDINKDSYQVNELGEEDISKDINQDENLREEDISKDIQKVNNLDFEEISSMEEGHNLVNNKVSKKVINNCETKPQVKDSSMPTIANKENTTSQLVITLDNSEVNNQDDESHIPADFLALPKGDVETKILAKTLGLSSSARVTELASRKKKTVPFPEFWEYLKVERIVKTNKNGREMNYYEWTKVK